ncbi:hypothetical protein GCM10022408_23640 [Hymenobacter fastidiosus]|uniref:Transporter n=1 Tax=Hymenobacter fastidiosus TaxID=486264 RepID=A0ABP7SED8_9BACT
MRPAAFALLWLILTAALLRPQPSSAGGGWTRPQGHGYGKLGLTAVNTTSYHTLAGQTIRTARFQQQVVGLYGEYGLTNRLEAVLNFPVYRRATFPGFTPGHGFGDAEIGLRYGVVQGQWPLAVGVAVEIPTGNPTERGFDRQDATSFVKLPTGDGEVNVWTRAALSHALSRLPAYFTLEAGYNKRTQGFTDQYSAGVQLGYKVKDKAWLTASVRTLSNVRTPRPDRLASIGLGEGVSYSTLDLGVNYALTKHLWLTTNAAGGFGKLRNVYSGVQVTVGAAVEF